MEVDSQLRVVLIGGSASVGKSTLAASLAGRLGWPCLSTDQLARHPGRPWKTSQRSVPEHVAEHYLSLSVEELVEDVLRHYQGMWPGIEAIIRKHAEERSAGRLILEGSALWPELVATLDCGCVGAVWLTASDELFRARITQMSGFEESSVRERRMVEKFLERTWLYDQQMKEAAERLGLAPLDVEALSSPGELGDEVLRLAAVSLPRFGDAREA
jgi:2-phosphoglycerate kinase